MNSERTDEPGFAPAEPTDGREPGNWQTRYSDPTAGRAIHRDALYLGAWLIFCLVFLVLLVLGMPQQWLSLSGKILQYFNLSIGAWLAGTLGGTLCSIKWLYHTVAHNMWNIDRRLWRFFTPIISGVFGFVVIIVVSSGLFGFFNPSAVDSLSFVIALGFLSGYVSDSAAGKLVEIATSIFGKTEKPGKRESERGSYGVGG